MPKNSATKPLGLDLPGSCFTKDFSSPNQNLLMSSFEYYSNAVGACAKFHGDKTSNIQMTALTDFDLKSENP